MRTTVEITQEQHRALSAIAQRRGVRGFSVLVQEALEGYLANLTTDEVDLLLGLEGVLSESDAREMRSRIEDARAAWRAS
jgi:metal-responsive CopG/Arc/MetJ family transcriptional regulator